MFDFSMQFAARLFEEEKLPSQSQTAYRDQRDISASATHHLSDTVDAAVRGY